MKRRGRVVKFHTRFRVHVGLIIVGILLIYLVFHIISFLSRDRIPVYEVHAGTAAAENHYNALEIRSEEVVTAPGDGYLYYFAGNGSHVGLYWPVIGIDASGSIKKSAADASDDLTALSEDSRSGIARKIASFTDSYDPDSFSDVYTFGSDLSDQVADAFRTDAAGTLADTITAAEGSGQFTDVYPSEPGFLLYTLDGGEDITAENWSAASFDAACTVTDLRTEDSVSAGTPVYKLVTSEDWELIVPVSSDTADSLKDTEYVRIRFDADGAETNAACAVTRKDDRNYLVLSLDDGMERYAKTRFTGIELLTDEANGLKIPDSAITEKQFMVIPKSYFLLGNDASDPGLMIRTSEGDSFVTPDIAYETDDSYYISDPSIQADSVIVIPDSGGTAKAGADTEPLPGVWNVNKGYAVFRRIEILRKSDDYTIIRSDTAGGIALYDHIALNGSAVQENEMIY